MIAHFLVEIAVKSSIVLLVTLGATRLMARRSSAAARHLVWAAGIGIVLCLPLLVLFGPAWRVAEVPDRWVGAARGVMNVAVGGTRADTEVWPVTSSPTNHAAMTQESGQRPTVSGTARRVLRSAANVWLMRWPDVLIRLWAAGVALGLSSLAIGLLSAAWLSRRAMPLTAPDWIALQADTMDRVKLTRRVRLSISGRIGIPVACGIVRPAVLLPLEAESWDATRRRVVLLHELAHVKRRDCLVQAVAHLTWAVHWFNPLAFVAVSRLRAEQERACDDIVLGVGTPAIEYADHLCEIAAAAPRGLVPTWAALAIARPSRLEARVTAILDETPNRRAASVRFHLAIAAVACLGSLPLGAMRASTAVQAMALLPSGTIQAIAPYSSLVPALQPGYMKETASSAEATTVSRAGAPDATAPAVQELTAESGRAFLETCITCHNSTLNTAGLALDKLDVARIGDNPEIWERVVRKLRAGLHPPGGRPRPSRAASDAFSASVEAALDRADQLNWASGVAEQLNQAEVSSRLSRFLWNSEPDETLVKLAKSGKLTDPVTLQQQVRRMVADGRSAALLTGFFGQWLSLKNLATIKPDPSRFPDFDEDLRQAFQRETDLFLASQVHEDHSLLDLLTADYTFLNDRLARHYGIAKIAGSQFRRVTLTDDARMGLLGRASILSVTSFAVRTSPVVRGKYLAETFLGTPPPPPPPNVPPLKNADAEHPVSMRARLEEHRRNAVCASCHSTMDPLGFALENFDALGRWRTSDEGAPIEAFGTLPDGSTFDGPAQLRGVLLDRRDAVLNTITLKLLAYALNRPAKYSDMPAVRAIVWNAAPGHYKWSSILTGIVRSAPFQMKRIE